MYELLSAIGGYIWDFIKEAFFKMNIYKFFFYVFCCLFGYFVLGNIF